MKKSLGLHCGIRPKGPGFLCFECSAWLGILVVSDRVNSSSRKGWRKESVSLGDKATGEGTKIFGERRLVFICGCPLVFGSKPLSSLFTEGRRK